MRTKLTIMGIVLGAILLSFGILLVLILALGLWTGVVMGAAIAAGVLLANFVVLAPWQHRWGATEEKVRRVMPGDEIIPKADSTTRAITIDARPEGVWPWLVQLGYGRAGWYSYDWIDNDGKLSADQIVPELQNLEVGDQILMLPGFGPKVRGIKPNEWFVCGGEEDGTWCLALYPTPEGTVRLVSRWRQDWPLTPATIFWILISDPGAFIMERKMLLNIKKRTENHERQLSGSAA